MSTSLAARGVDVPDVSLVVNYEVPLEQDDYIHRIGRTGRGGRRGVAVTLFSPEEQVRAPGVQRVLTGSGQGVPDWLSEMAAAQPSSISSSRPQADHDESEIEVEVEVGGTRVVQSRKPKKDRSRRQGQGEGAVGPTFSSWRKQPMGVFLSRRSEDTLDNESSQVIDQEEVRANASALLERWNQIINGKMRLGT